MKKGFGFIAIILLSAAAVSASTAVVERSNGKEEKSASKRSDNGVRRSSRVLRIGPSTTYLKNGLSINEVLRLLGQPASKSERMDADVRLATYTFPRSEGRVLIAEFENGVLVASRTEMAEAVIAGN
jgi:hypothetical protein